MGWTASPALFSASLCRVPFQGLPVLTHVRLPLPLRKGCWEPRSEMREHDSGKRGQTGFQPVPLPSDPWGSFSSEPPTGSHSA